MRIPNLSRVVRTRPTPRTVLRVESLEDRLTPAVDPTLRGLTVATADFTGDGIPDLVVAPGAGNAPRIVVYSGADGAVISSFLSHEESFLGGVFVAVGDVTGDGTPEVVAGTGDGGGARVTVTDPLTGRQLASFFAYPQGFSGGVRVAVGDVDGDGTAEIVTAPGAGGGPHVRVFDGTGKNLGRDFLAHDESFRGGMAIAAGDADGDGAADVFTTPGDGGAAHVKIFDGKTGTLTESYFAFAPALRGGAWIAAGDVDGNGLADAVVGGRVWATDLPVVRVFAGHGTSFTEWEAYEPASRGGVRVAVGDTNGDGFAEVFTGPGNGDGPRVTAWDGYTFAPSAERVDAATGQPLGTRGVERRTPLLDGRTLVTPAGGDFEASADLLRRLNDHTKPYDKFDPNRSPNAVPSPLWWVRPNEFGIYEVDDAEGRVNGLLPGDEGYAEAALADARRVTLFAPTDDPGKTATFTMKAGKRYAAYLMQNGTTAEWKANLEAFRATGTIQIEGGPYPGFAFPAGSYYHGTDWYRTGPRNRVAFEDGNDSDWNDMLVGFRGRNERSDLPGYTTPLPPSTQPVIFPPVVTTPPTKV